MHKNALKKQNYLTWNEVANKWKNSKLKILNIMSGANSGGEFLNSRTENEDLEQKVIIRHHQKRFDYLNTKLNANLLNYSIILILFVSL